MICPLRSLKSKGCYDQEQYEDLDCLKEECAWWDKAIEECAPIALNIALCAMGSVLGKIADKLPTHVPKH